MSPSAEGKWKGKKLLDNKMKPVNKLIKLEN